MYQGGGNFENDLYSNIPSMAMMFAMYTPTFGNGNFVVQPASPGAVQDGFPTVPYFPLEAMIYQQQNSNPVVAPTNIMSGNTAGVQSIKGSQTISDQSGTVRMVSGYQPGGF